MYHGFRKALSLTGSLLLIWIFIQFFLPLCFPFLLGAVLALAAEPMVSFLSRFGHFRRFAATALGVTAALFFVLFMLAFILALAVREAAQLVQVLPDLESAVTGGLSALSAWTLTMISRLPPGIRDVLGRGIQDFYSGSSRILEQVFSFALSLTGSILSQVPDSALVLGTAVISAYMISARLPRIRQWILRRIPRDRIDKVLSGLSQFRSSVAGWLKAQLKLMGITWVILVLGLVLLRIPHAPFWAAAVSLVDAFPILGTGTVLLPWALVSLVNADHVRALGLLGIYVVISLSRSILEPRLLGNHLGLDPLVTLGALYAGYKLWGFGGMILSPLLAVAIVQLIQEPAG